METSNRSNACISLLCPHTWSECDKRMNDAILLCLLRAKWFIVYRNTMDIRIRIGKLPVLNPRTRSFKLSGRFWFRTLNCGINQFLLSVQPIHWKEGMCHKLHHSCDLKKKNRWNKWFEKSDSWKKLFFKNS